ncbi:aminoglycoside resistance protein [Arthrobacter crusticola]|uniref:Aminoglycoside resistance protein n=1 Tax=Arthrobacter crusticola TaxID=2547960 RepID=A0A4V3AMI0_9MICC|nr:aminoglycoside phosphotransferase family protein [Arthrobacter crusticola]TDK26952.1 aminoglycoside resistance protein [Arthrobacter crusticola]
MTGFAVELPEGLKRAARQLPGGSAWLRNWPGILQRYLEAWELTLDLPSGRRPWSGQCSVVLPVRSSNGGEAALKIGVPHEESRTEPEALTLWDGAGAVRLLAFNAADSVLLLERLDARRPLGSLPLEQTTAIWGALVRRLSLRPDGRSEWAQIPALAPEAETWTDTLPADWEAAGRPFPRWLLEHALETCQVRGAVGRRSARDVLVHSDLHYGNILARPTPEAGDVAEQPSAGGFVAIDPKPLLGDAEYAVAPMLWNRIGDLPAADAPGQLRLRCAALAAAAGLDPELARDWAVVREVRNALYYLETGSPGDARRSLWVASSLLGRTLPDLPPAHLLSAP